MELAVCRQGDTVNLWIPTRRAFGEYASVDRCIAPLVAALNATGFETVASCCGHGRQPGNVILRDGREIFIAPDFDTARLVNAAFPPINDPVPDECVVYWTRLDTVEQCEAELERLKRADDLGGNHEMIVRLALYWARIREAG
jgi:hypothetical protein